MIQVVRSLMYFACIAIVSHTAHAQPDPGKTRQNDTDALRVGELTAQSEESLLEHLREHHQSAAAFVVNQFEKHDVVLLGEDHQVADNCRFVSSLIEPLYHAGVRTLAWEFTRSSFNDDIARLVTADDFDDELANQLLRRGPWPTWGYEEYRDILQSAWRLNRSLPPGAPRFRVIALDSEWSQHKLWFGKLDRVQVFHTIADREKHMTNVLKSETLKKNEKALVHIGYAHTLTQHGSRLGKVLTDEYGSRIKQVTLHTSWRRQDGSAPLGDLLGRLATEAGGGKPIGFDVINSPLGQLTDASSGVFRFAARGGILADVSQSYVFLKPLKDLKGVKWIPGFIIEENFEQACAIADRMKWTQQQTTTTPAELDTALNQRFRGEHLGNPSSPK